MIKHLIILLVVAAACYGGVTWMYRQIDDGFSEAVSSGSAADGKDQVEKGRSDKTNQLQVDAELITRRNIFLAPDGSGGSDSASDPLASLEQSAPDLLLVGTVVNTDGGNRAIIYQVEQKKQLLVKEGDVINGVSIKEIKDGKTVISRRGRNETLDIAAASELRRTKQNVIQVKNQAPAAPEPVETPLDRIEAEALDEEGQAQLQVDPGKLGKTSGGTIIKGRITQ